MQPHLLVMLAVIGEATLVVIAVVWANLRDIPILTGSVVLGVTVGLFTASVLSLTIGTSFAVLRMSLVSQGFAVYIKRV